MSQQTADHRIDIRPLDSPASHMILPEPPGFWSRRVFGPSAVFTAMAIGSGELVFWPGLSLSNGAGVLWIATVVVLLQYVMNIEIGRYSLAAGESAVLGGIRLWKGWAWILLAGAVIPWLWPGWARAGCQLIGSVFDLPEKPLSVASLILCGLLLALPKRVYTLVERLQTVLLVIILVGVLGLCVIALNARGSGVDFWTGFLAGHGVASLLRKASELQNDGFMALLGGIVFAGGGGILNLGYGLLLCEKGFGMGAYARPVVGLRHSLGLQPMDEARTTLDDTVSTRVRWHQWLSLTRREHALLFAGGNLFTIFLLALTFYALLGPGTEAKGTTFLISATERFGEIGGGVASLLFVIVAFAIFFTSEIGIIDITSRIAAGIIHSRLRPGKISASTLYHGIVWFEIVIGAFLTIVDPRQPFWFLITSGVLNTVVMMLYAGLIAHLNRKSLPQFARTNIPTTALMWLVSIIYGSLFVVTLLQLVR